MREKIKEIGLQLRERRQLLDMTQPELAALTDVSTRTIQQVENGKGNPSFETLIRLADSLGLQIELSLKELQKSINE
jgi:y4mF family transcriptional regulator